MQKVSFHNAFPQQKVYQKFEIKYQKYIFFFFIFDLANSEVRIIGRSSNFYDI